VRLTYILDATDVTLRSVGKVKVTWRAEGFEDRVTAFCLQVYGHDYPIDTHTFGPRPPWEDRPTDSDERKGKPACPEGFRAMTDNLAGKPLEARFELDVRKGAFSACGCEFNSYLGTAWGIVKAEALAIPFSYAFFEPKPAFTATVRLLLPSGWRGEAPWLPAGENAFTLPGGGDPTVPPLPRGFIALGRFDSEPHAAEALGKEFVYVRLADEIKDRATLFTYLEKATPYYQSVYGDVVGQRVLVVSAGAPMFTGGLGATDSLFVHENSTLETIAHEYAHVWQRFQTVGEAGRSSIWLNEGDADLHGALSRFVTEVEPGLTIDKLNSDFLAQYNKASKDTKLQAPLAAAAYGERYEQVAYKKGMFTLIQLDSEVRRITGGGAGLREFLRGLNQEWDRIASERTGDLRLTNTDALAVLNKVVQRHANIDMLNFFKAYVWGNATDQECSPGCWPPYAELPPEAPVVFDKLGLSPEQPVAGEPLTVTVEATNVRSSPQDRDVVLLIDDAEAETKSVHLGSQERATLTFTTPSGAPGTHTARIAYLTEDYRALVPARLRIDLVEPVTRPEAGVSFQLAVDVANDGEAGAVAVVQAQLLSQRRDTQVRVDGHQKERATLSFLPQDEGTAEIRVAVGWANQTALESVRLTVFPRDRDHDGTPDKADAYPDNPKLAEKNVVNDARNAVPGLGAGLVIAGIGLVGLAAVRRRRMP